MRLDRDEKKALKEAVEEVDDPVYLFGSRVVDTARGGDIDILILSDRPPLKLSCRVAAAFNMVCEEKVDVVVIPRTENLRTAEQNAFLNTIERERVK